MALANDDYFRADELPFGDLIILVLDGVVNYALTVYGDALRPAD